MENNFEYNHTYLQTLSLIQDNWFPEFVVENVAVQC